MRTWFTALLLSLFVIIPCATMAQGTPDGKTPHMETICDGETGAAYGLCNAYCEAMDCDSENRHASEKACSKIKNKFEKLTGRDLTCGEQPPDCPCLPKFNTFIDNLDAYSTCFYIDGEMEVSNNMGGEPTETSFISRDLQACGYFNSFDPDLDLFVEGIPPEQLADCENLLLDAIENADLFCDYY